MLCAVYNGIMWPILFPVFTHCNRHSPKLLSDLFEKHVFNVYKVLKGLSVEYNP